MTVLFTPRSSARLTAVSAVSAVALSLVPVTASALSTAAPLSVHARHAPATDGLCDGHKWSLFGCRPDHHRIQQPGADAVPSAG